jgi:hypothetical protein
MTQDEFSLGDDDGENPFAAPMETSGLRKPQRADATSIFYRRKMQRGLISLRCTLGLAGFILIVVYGLALFAFERVVKPGLQEELETTTFEEVEREEAKREFDKMMLVGRAMLGTGLGLGIAMFVGAFLAHAAPKAVAISALASFVLYVAVLTITRLSTLDDGIVLQLGIICILIVSVGAAFTYANAKRYFELRR